MTINHKTGEVKLEGFGIDVNDFRDSKTLEKTKEKYNANKGLTKPYYPDLPDWPKGIWYDIYYSMLRNLIDWKDIKKIRKSK